MLSVDQYEHIRTAHRDYGQSVSEIARLTGHSRNTVRKALSGQFSGYTPRQSQPFPVLGSYRAFIDKWFQEDRGSPPKQRHTARRVYTRLVNEYGFTGSESNVRRYVNLAKKEMGLGLTGAFIPLEPDLGREAEVDWGTAIVNLEGQEVRVKLFCMRSKGSGKPFLRLYPCERQQAFFDGMIQAFDYYNGVFPVLVFDNLTSAVRKILNGKKRLEQESFSRFRSWYTFEARFCNPGKGNEKGGVEGLVGFARRNFLVPVPCGKSMDDINEALLKECVSSDRHKIRGQSETVGERHQREREQLLSLPKYPYSNEQTCSLKAGKYATVTFDRNRYSVPAAYAGSSLRAISTVEQVRIYSGNRCLVGHDRTYGNNKWILDLDHYLDLLRIRPGAFEDARPVRESKKNWGPELNHLLEYFRDRHGQSHGIKEFVDVLLLCREHSQTDVLEAIRLALAKGLSTAAGIRHLLESAREPSQRFLPLETSRWKKLPPADVTPYAALETLS